MARSTGTKSVNNRSANNGSDDQRARILAISARLFAHKGFYDTSISDIADETKLSKAALYYYFDGKQTIIDAIIVDTLNKLIMAVSSGINDADDPLKKLRAAMEHHAQFIEDNYWSFTAMLWGFSGLRSQWREKAVDLRDEYEALFRTIIFDGQRAGTFREDLDVVTTARAALSMVNWMSRWYKPGKQRRAREFAADYSEILLNGIIK